MKNQINKWAGVLALGLFLAGPVSQAAWYSCSYGSVKSIAIYDDHGGFWARQLTSKEKQSLRFELDTDCTYSVELKGPKKEGDQVFYEARCYRDGGGHYDKFVELDCQAL